MSEAQGRTTEGTQWKNHTVECYENRATYTQGTVVTFYEVCEQRFEIASVALQNAPHVREIATRVWEWIATFCKITPKLLHSFADSGDREDVGVAN